jgi:hypothetical protein
MSEAKFGEPWRLEGDLSVTDRSGRIVFVLRTIDFAFWSRIHACTSALAGVADPAAAIDGARRALELAANTLYQEGYGAAADECRAASDALGRAT